MNHSTAHPGLVDEDLLARAASTPAPFAFWAERLARLGRELTTPDQPPFRLDAVVEMMADTVATYFAWDAERGEAILVDVERLQAKVRNLTNNAARPDDTRSGCEVSLSREATTAGSESGTGRIRSIDDARSA